MATFNCLTIQQTRIHPRGFIHKPRIEVPDRVFGVFFILGDQIGGGKRANDLAQANHGFSVRDEIPGVGFPVALRPAQHPPDDGILAPGDVSDLGPAPGEIRVGVVTDQGDVARGDDPALRQMIARSKEELGFAHDQGGRRRILKQRFQSPVQLLRAVAPVGQVVGSRTDTQARQLVEKGLREGRGRWFASFFAHQHGDALVPQLNQMAHRDPQGRDLARRGPGDPQARSGPEQSEGRQRLIRKPFEYAAGGRVDHPGIVGLFADEARHPHRIHPQVVQILFPVFHHMPGILQQTPNIAILELRQLTLVIQQDADAQTLRL